MYAPSEPIEGEDFYWDGPYMVFTAAYHLKRGYCCNSGCRHCPYSPKDEQSIPSKADRPEGTE
jgi:uncharacterized protein DUF5522